MTSIIKVDTVQDVDGNNIISENANTITIGASGDTISIPAGATLVNSGTATGFGLTWQSVQTTGFTAVKGNAYPCNTTSAAFTVTLPATPSAGDQVQLVDYAGTFDTNALTISPNGNKIESGTDNLRLSGEREGVILTYIDATQGWIATSGINEGTDALEPLSYSAEYLVVAGGASGGRDNAGGGGAGGLLTNYGVSTITLTIGQVYTVTVGAGGASRSTNNTGDNGSNSVLSGSGISTVTAIGGGGGGYNASGNKNGLSGGSGGGGSHGNPGGTGGSATSPQGNNGGDGAGNLAPAYGGGGGGGAGAVGGNGNGSNGGNGGNGLSNSITGSAITYAGGGGGYANSSDGDAGTGGTGGGGDGKATSNGGAGGTNLGGGGGGVNANVSQISGAGGSGVVILRLSTAKYSGTTTGSPTITTTGTDTVIKFTASGSYTA